MRVLTMNHMTLAVDFAAGSISSLILNQKERIAGTTPLFRLRLRHGAIRIVCSPLFPAHNTDSRIPCRPQPCIYRSAFRNAVGDLPANS